MRAKRNISAIVIALMCVLSITAQKIIPVDSTHLLSIEQKQTIEFIKKHIDKNNSELELPLEVNYLLGDTKAKDHYKMKPIWKESYFLSSDSVELIVPLQNGSIDILQCQLRVDKVDNNSYYQKIETVLGKSGPEGLLTGSMVYSTIKGNLIRIYNFNNGECVEIINNDIIHLDLFIGTGGNEIRENFQYNDLSKKANKRVDKLVKPRELNRLEIKQQRKDF